MKIQIQQLAALTSLFSQSRRLYTSHLQNTFFHIVTLNILRADLHLVAKLSVTKIKRLKNLKLQDANQVQLKLSLVSKNP